MTAHRIIIDTSIFGAAVGIGVTDGDEPAFVEISENVADSARQLPAMVERGLMSVGGSFGSLHEILVSRGPGSFTGIRVGLAYAFGLKSGAAIDRGAMRMAGISSLEMIAASQVGKKSNAVAIFLPSTKTTGYLALADEQGSDILAVDTQDTSRSDLDLGHRIQNALQISIGAWECLLSSKFVDSGRPVETWEPRVAAAVGLKAMWHSAAGWNETDWQMRDTSPLYLRRSSVEEKALLGVGTRR